MKDCCCISCLWFKFGVWNILYIKKHYLPFQALWMSSHNKITGLQISFLIRICLRLFVLGRKGWATIGKEKALIQYRLKICQCIWHHMYVDRVCVITLTARGGRQRFCTPKNICHGIPETKSNGPWNSCLESKGQWWGWQRYGGGTKHKYWFDIHSSLCPEASPTIRQTKQVSGALGPIQGPLGPPIYFCPIFIVFRKISPQ